MVGKSVKNKIILIICVVVITCACSSESDFKITGKYWMHYDYRDYEGYVLNDYEFNCLINGSIDAVKSIDCNFINSGYDIDYLINNLQDKNVEISKSGKLSYNNETIDYIVISIMEKFHDRTIIISSNTGVIFDSYHHNYMRELDSLKYSINGENATIRTVELLKMIIKDADLWKDPPGPVDN